MKKIIAITSAILLISAPAFVFAKSGDSTPKTPDNEVSEKQSEKPVTAINSAEQRESPAAEAEEVKAAATVSSHENESSESAADVQKEDEHESANAAKVESEHSQTSSVSEEDKSGASNSLPEAEHSGVESGANSD